MAEQRPASNDSDHAASEADVWRHDTQTRAAQTPPPGYRSYPSAPPSGVVTYPSGLPGGTTTSTGGVTGAATGVAPPRRTSRVNSVLMGLIALATVVVVGLFGYLLVHQRDRGDWHVAIPQGITASSSPVPSPTSTADFPEKSLGTCLERVTPRVVRQITVSGVRVDREDVTCAYLAELKDRVMSYLRENPDATSYKLSAHSAVTGETNVSCTRRDHLSTCTTPPGSNIYLKD